MGVAHTLDIIMTTYNRKKKTVIGPMLPTPMWAKIVFRVALYVNAGMLMYVAGSSLIPEPLKTEIMLISSAFVLPGIHLLSKVFGLKEKD